MTECFLSPRAAADIEEIWDYTVSQWNFRQGEIYIRDIQAAMSAIAANPALGRSCEAIRAGYRKLGVQSHVIFYRITDRGVEVVRILHQRMDFGTQLGTDI